MNSELHDVFIRRSEVGYTTGIQNVPKHCLTQCFLLVKSVHVVQSYRQPDFNFPANKFDSFANSNQKLKMDFYA